MLGVRTAAGGWDCRRAAGRRGTGDLAAEAGVFLAEPCALFQELVPFGVGGWQAAEQQVAGGALAGRDGRGGRPAGGVAEPPDLLADVVLGIQPGAGHSGMLGDAAKVTRVPAWSSSRIARIALARVSSRRRRAAAIIGAVLSGRIGCRLAGFVRVPLQGRDDLLEAAGGLTVHLRHPGLAVHLGRGDDLQRLLVLCLVLGQEFGGGDEHRAGQAPRWRARTF